MLEKIYADIDLEENVSSFQCSQNKTLSKHPVLCCNAESPAYASLLRVELRAKNHRDVCASCRYTSSLCDHTKPGRFVRMMQWSSQPDTQSEGMRRMEENTEPEITFPCYHLTELEMLK